MDPAPCLVDQNTATQTSDSSNMYRPARQLGPVDSNVRKRQTLGLSFVVIQDTGFSTNLLSSLPFVSGNFSDMNRKSGESKKSLKM